METKQKTETVSELLEMVNKEKDYQDRKAMLAYQDAQDALDERKPFSEIKNEIDWLKKHVGRLNETVEKLLVHKHVDGQVTIPADKIAKLVYGDLT